MANKHKGSTVESFLEEEGLLADAEAAAFKRVIAFEFSRAMKKRRLTKSQMADEMRTSRSALERLLDPRNTSVTLNTLVKVARAMGKKLKLSFV